MVLDLPSLHDYAMFDSFTPAQYRKYTSVAGKKPVERDPACLVELKGSTFCNLVKLDIPRFGKYVTIKILGM